MIYTTLNRIRIREHEHEPYAGGWRKLLKYLGKTEADDDPLVYSTILDAVGLDYALWCLRAEPQNASIWRMYAVRCARRVQHLMTDERSILALDVAERHARGLATDAELDAARLDAEETAWSAWNAGRPDWSAWHAAWAARDAAGPDAGAARDAALDAAGTVSGAAWYTARDEQAADFRALLAAHHAMPGESCALVDWWQGESND